MSITHRLMSSHGLGRKRSWPNRGTFRGFPRKTKNKTQQMYFWQLVMQILVLTANTVVGLFQSSTSTEVEILKVLDNHSLFNPSQSDNMKVLFCPFLPLISERSWPHLNVHRLCPLLLMTITLRCRLVQSDGGLDCPAIELRPHQWETGGKLHNPWHGHIWQIKIDDPSPQK